MQKFHLDGFYNYNRLPSGRGQLSGELEIAQDGSFESIITDHASVAPAQCIKGFIDQENRLNRLQFLKFPPRTILANLAYDLTKPVGREIEGTYKGIWGALPYKVEFDKDSRLTLARINVSACPLGDSAEITLRR
jgi:hypothetical protein